MTPSPGDETTALHLLEEDDSLHGLTCYRCGGPATRWGYVDTILDVPWCEECWLAFVACFRIQHTADVAREHLPQRGVHSPRRDEGGDTDG